MSAIFGIIHFDGQPATRGDLDLMNAALTAHGPDGNGVRVEGNVGLGQRLMRFTPEDCLEQQPAMDAGGRRVLVSDARIDNRPELIEELGILPAEASELPDSGFILRAYERWGADCARHLIGAFVFALYDREEQSLLIARSQLGDRSLFFYETPRLLAFASAPKGLFALPFVERKINPQSVADFLAHAAKEPGSSFFSGISRLQPGHSLVAGRGGFRSRQYHQIETGRRIRFARDDDYVEAFRDVLDLAVTRQMRSLTPVGVSMSGGLDSATIAAVMARVLGKQGKRLLALTEVPPPGFSGNLPRGRYADETPYVQAMARRYDNIDLHFVHTSEGFYLNELDRFFAAGDAPMRNASNWPWMGAILRDAREQDARILMTGVPGNHTISWEGEGLFSELLRRGKWGRALREARALTPPGSAHSPLRMLISRGLMPLLPDWLWHARQRQRARQPLIASRPPWDGFSPIRAEFARSQRVAERARAKGEDFRFRTSPAHRARILTRQADPRSDGRRGSEVLYGIRQLDPASDIRLVEFCLRLPEDQFLRDGQSRWLIRRAMAGRLPVEVQENRLRGLQAANWLAVIRASRPRLDELFARLERSALAVEALDLSRMRRLLAQIEGARDSTHEVMSWRDQLELGLTMGCFVAWVEGAS